MKDVNLHKVVLQWRECALEVPRANALVAPRTTGCCKFPNSYQTNASACCGAKLLLQIQMTSCESFKHAVKRLEQSGPGIECHRLIPLLRTQRVP